MVVLMVAAFAAFGISSGQAQTPDKVVTLNPTSGPPGTVVTAELFNAPPNDPITVIFKIPGDPILTTGTTDATGHATFTFTIPNVPGGGTWPVFFTDFKCSCQLAVDFTVINVRPTNTPTRTPTTPPPPPSATPTPTTTQAPPPTATATPTPGVPVLGTTSSMGGPGPNIGILALGAMAVVTVLAWFGATRRGPRPGALAVACAESRDDYSTDLDAATLDAILARPAANAPVRKCGGRGPSWALGAGLGAIAGLVLMRRK